MDKQLLKVLMFEWFSLGNILSIGRRSLPHNSCNEWAYFEILFSIFILTSSITVIFCSAIFWNNISGPYINMLISNMYFYSFSCPRPVRYFYIFCSRPNDETFFILTLLWIITDTNESSNTHKPRQTHYLRDYMQLVDICQWTVMMADQHTIKLMAQQEHSRQPHLVKQIKPNATMGNPHNHNQRL
jgi:hypothetical protein